jgi:hypothetical protein
VPCTMDERISRVIKTRIDRILLVLENVTDNRNYLAALRTCDVLGVQRVWVIHSADKKTVDPSQLAVAAAATAAGETDTPVQTEEVIPTPPLCGACLPVQQHPQHLPALCIDKARCGPFSMFRPQQLRQPMSPTSPYTPPPPLLCICQGVAR